MNNRRTALAIALVVTIVSVLHLLSDNSHNDSDGVINYVLNKSHRSLRQTSPYFDPKTITQKESSPFIVPEANLADTKHAEPTVIRDRSSPQRHIGVVVDVLSIGSKARLELLTAQMETWASHVSVRNFWGVTEEQDYNVNCGEQSQEALLAYRQGCWDPNKRTFVSSKFGNFTRYRSVGWGWYCAQRRPGHALGWLQNMYQNPANVPDILIIVDDDTSVDIEEVQRHMSTVRHSSYVGNPCCNGMPVGGLSHTGAGGAGTFFNRAAIEALSQPIFCDNRKKEKINSICKNLEANRVGEHDVFQQGDSVFDIFYKYSAIRDFCMHSDWAMGYMINAYSGSSLQSIHQCEGLGLKKSLPCKSDSISCHYQSPEAMKQFVLSRTCPESPFVGWPATSDC